MWHVLKFVYQGHERYYAKTTDGNDTYWTEKSQNATLFKSREAAQDALFETGVSLPVLDDSRKCLIFHLNEYASRDWWTIDGAESETIDYQIVPLVMGEPIDNFNFNVEHDTIFGRESPRLCGKLKI